MVLVYVVMFVAAALTFFSAEVIQNSSSERIEVSLVGVAEEFPLASQVVDALRREVRQHRKRWTCREEVAEGVLRIRECQRSSQQVGTDRRSFGICNDSGHRMRRTEVLRRRQFEPIRSLLT